jgi:hypothetical protein
MQALGLGLIRDQPKCSGEISDPVAINSPAVVATARYL